MLYAPLITPFAEDESVDFEALAYNLSLYENSPLTGYLVNGSSGEAEMLTLEERNAVLKKVVGATDRPVLAGIIASSIRDALRQIDDLANLSLEAVLVRTPSYYGRQMDQVEFFRTLADKASLPIMIYQIPQYTGVKLTGEELCPLSEHPNIVGIKDSLGDLALLNECAWPIDFRYFLGASALLQPGMAAGACGGILALANVVPELCARLLRLAQKADLATEARALQRALIPLNRMLGGSRGFGLAGLKEACRLQGFRTGPVRKPLRALSAGQIRMLKTELEKLPV